ncbi:MAG: N-acetyltransferase family protein [Natronomonas sp.]
MVEIRLACEGDVDAIRGVAKDTLYTAYGGFASPKSIEQAFEEWYDPGLVEAAISADEIMLWVADDDGTVFGFASAEQTWADEIELHVIYVHPDRWGEGFGTALFEEVKTWAADVDVDRIACTVFTDNTIGMSFFEGRGFQGETEVLTELGEEQHPEREVVYEL